LLRDWEVRERANVGIRVNVAEHSRDGTGGDEWSKGILEFVVATPHGGLEAGCRQAVEIV
jgi:hypothetical protein